MVAGVGIGDAAAAGGHAIKPAVVQGLEKNQDRSRPGDLLSVDELLATAELAGGDEVLNVGDHHRNDRPRAWTRRWPRPPFRPSGPGPRSARSRPAGARPAPSGIRTPAGRISGLTMSPDPERELLHSPLTPARTTVFARSTSAWANAASALAFSAGSNVEICASAACLAAVAASIAPWRPSTATCSFSISRGATMPGLRR